MADKKNKNEVSKVSNKTKKRFITWAWGLFFLGCLSIFFLFFSITQGWIGYLPPIEELQNPKNKFASEIFSSDNQVIGSFHTSKDNRVNTSFQDLSPYLVQALIATEDVRFEKHSGIDGKALGRVLILRAILQRKGAGGGSTITQQLSKQLYSPMAKNIIERAMQKPIEWVIATQLEKLYTKEEILTMYLNKFDFLNNAVGIYTASHVYFGKDPIQLNMEESATLIGMCKNPSLFNPVSKRGYPLCHDRRNVVLKQMQKAEYISQNQYDSISQIPLTLNYSRVDHKTGTAPYFREHLRLMLTAKEPKLKNYNRWQKGPYGKYYMDSIEWATNPLYGFCNKVKKKDGSKYNIYLDGLKIYTTLDSRMQKYAEQAVKNHCKDIQAKFFKSKRRRKKAPFAWDTSNKLITDIMNHAMKQTDLYRHLKKQNKSKKEIEEIFNTPHEMRVIAYAPIEDTENLIMYKDTILSSMDSLRYLKYFMRCGMMSMEPSTGHVKAYVGGPSFSQFQYDMVSVGRRQVGSTVKPYLYTLAMSEGYWPCMQTKNEEITLYDKLGREFTPRNSGKKRIGEMVTLKWGLQNSNNWIAAYVMSLLSPEQLLSLMRSFGIKGKIVPTVSLCLGPCEVSVEEMVSAYTTFPNKGVKTSPIYVTRIEDNMGNVIADFTTTTTEVIDELTCQKMVYMMKGTIDEGTGRRVRYKYNIKAPAGGKTGTTQKNADGWFMGYTPTLVTGVWAGWEDRTVHFANMLYGQGAAMALPIWGLYMRDVFDDETLGYDETEDFSFLKDFNPNEGCE